jgi:hypothetical protein
VRIKSNTALRYLRRKINLILSFLIRICTTPLLKRLGYLNTVPDISSPESHWYKHISLLDSIRGLHSLPSVKRWLFSRISKRSYDQNGALPWITFPALEFLKTLSLQQFKIVEFGSGASTIWLSGQCKELISYEFDSVYFKAMREVTADSNVRLVDVQALFDGLTPDVSCSSFLSELLHNDKDKENFAPGFWEFINVPRLVDEFKNSTKNADLVFVDGGLRSFVLGIISESVSDTCLVVVDNSDVEWVRTGVVELLRRNFIEIPFIGFGPLNDYEWRTSVLARNFGKAKPAVISNK